MTLRDIGELVVIILVCISVPTYYALSKVKKGESFENSKLPIIWPILVGIPRAFYVHSIDPYWTVTPFITCAVIGIFANAAIYSLIDKRVKEKKSAKEEMDRKDAEIRSLRNKINEIQRKEEDKR